MKGPPLTTVDRADGALAQTLSRGIAILEFLAERGAAASIPEIVEGVGLHRSIAYRLLRTLEHHRLVARDGRGYVSLGPRLASLAASVDRDLQSAAFPALRAAAEELGATCFLVVLDHGEVITLVSVEPSRSIVTVAEHPGTRHPLGIGAPGKAILLQLPRPQWPTSLNPAQLQEADQAEQLGYATSRSEVVSGLQSVAVPLSIEGRSPLSLAVVYVATERQPEELATRLCRVGDEVRRALGH